MEEELTIHEVAAQTGLSVHTLRYYERIGLLDPVSRGSSGHRRYMADDIVWISFLQCLRKTGMSIRQMQAYAVLRRQGDVSIPERLVFLEEHHRQIQENMHELESYLKMVERKIQHNRNMLTEESKNTNQVPVSSRSL
jgi:DNA-binding transcriptional MerR regulator